MEFNTTHHTTPHHTAPHHTTLHYTNCIALHCITLHYITLHSLHHHECNCNYTTLITLHHNYNSTTLQLQLQLHYTTLHPAVVGEVTDQVTTAPIAATPKKHSPNHLSVHQWICSAIRDSQQPISPIGFLVLKLPPPPCAVLLVTHFTTPCRNLYAYIKVKTRKDFGKYQHTLSIYIFILHSTKARRSFQTNKFSDDYKRNA